MTVLYLSYLRRMHLLLFIVSVLNKSNVNPIQALDALRVARG
jgi:hypothetical protein